MIKLQQESFQEPESIHQYDDEPVVVHSRSGRLMTDLVLFVHGLTGHRYGYWGLMPRFILEDVATADVGLYFYRTAWKRLRLFKSIDIEDEARVLADFLRQARLYQAITIVGHSMGGLLAKAAIVDLLNRGDKRTLRRISGLILLACPQLGSSRVPRVLKVFSRDGRALFPHSKTIMRIDSTYAARLSVDQTAEPLDKHSIPTWAVVAAEDFWVDALSAGVGVPDAQKLTVRGSHASIVQPTHRSADAYVFLRGCLDMSFGSGSTKMDSLEIQVDEARPEDVASIRSLAVRFFGEDVTPEDVLVDFAARGKIFYVVKRIISAEGEKREQFAGYFCILPLTADSTAAVKTGALRGGHITPVHLSAQPDQTVALYVGAVAARDYYSRAVVMEALRLNVQQAINAGVREVLARPFTKDGLRIVRAKGFKPFIRGGIGEIYTLASPKSAS